MSTSSSRRPPFGSNSRLNDSSLPSPAASTSQFSATSGYGGPERGSGAGLSLQGSGSGSGGGGGGMGGGGGSPDSRAVAKDHWEALRTFLVEFLKKEPPNSRANAREKLTRLTRQQFQELSTDVYDELMRRVGDGGPDSPGEVPFLPLRPDFHPKRNQARQKLATLPKSRFKDLASDVYYELNRRYPEFSEPEQPEPQPRSPSSNYSASTPITPGYPNSSSNNNNNNNQYNDPYPPSLPSNSNDNAPRPSSNRSRDSNERERDRNYITSPTSSQPSGTSRPPYQTSNRQASITRTLSSSSNPGGLPPPSNYNSNNNSNNSSTSNPPSSFVTTSTIVPNKSTIAEEDIQVPYARDSNPSPPTETLGSPNLGGSEAGGEYYDRMSFGSATSRARGNTNGSNNGGGGGGGNWDREREELKRDYEYRIANLTGKLGQLEGGVENAKEGEAREREGRERAERDMDAVKEQLATFNESLRTLGRELDETRSAASREKEKVRTLETQLRESTEDHERALSEEREKGGAKEVNGQSSSETLTELKSQVQDLVQELNSLSLMHEELHRERENDQQRIRQAEEKAREMEQKWRSTKTELRNLKATSQMFVSAPRTEDHLPASSTGALTDIHVTAFQTSIDGLITAARSTTPTSVLGAMKPVIGAMANISLDVQAFEDRPPATRIHVDMSALQSLKDRSTQNLNILTHSAKEFAMSYGLSPISLLDAAASELAANVVGLFKLLGIRRADKKEVERLERASNGVYTNGTGNGNVNGLGMVPSSRPAVARDGAGGGGSSARPDSTASNQSGTTDRYDARSSTGTARADPAPSSANLSSRMDPRRMTSTSSIGSAFDLERKPSTTGTDSGSVGGGGGGGGGRRGLDRNMGSWDSRASNGGGFQPPSLLEERDESDRDGEEEEELDDDGDRAWTELKPYLDTQSESLIQAIQTLLSSVRSGEPTPQLRDHLSSVIVIGSSIVGVSKDSLPLRSLGEGRRLLRELAGNCDLLSELSEGEEMGKSQRNRIAQTTFELAKNLKNLMNL